MKFFLIFNFMLSFIFFNLTELKAKTDPFINVFQQQSLLGLVGKPETKINSAVNTKTKDKTKPEDEPNSSQVCADFSEVKFSNIALAEFSYKGFSQNTIGQQSYDFFFLYQDKIATFNLGDVFSSENLRLEKVEKNKLILSKYKQCEIIESLEWEL